MDFIKALEAYLPDIRTRLNMPGNSNALKKLEDLTGESLPPAFNDFYTQYDGEKYEPYTAVILGFTLMDMSNILETVEEFMNNDFSEITSLTPDKVSDEKMCDRIMIPFAWDQSRCYFCLDLTPDTQGKKGQIITLDYDYDECMLVADSLEDFFAFILKMLQEGKCYTTSEDADHAYFSFETGHFFNVMKDLLLQDSGEQEDFELPEIFWRSEYKADKVPVSTLQKTTKLFISKKEEMTLSLTPLTHMSKLRELIIHSCTITDFECICHAAELKTLYLVDCTFDYNDLNLLTKLPKLNHLHLGKMPLTDISCLAQIKSLKRLGLRKLPNLDTSQLTLLNKMQELELEDITLDNLDFLNTYKGLKVLQLKDVNVPDLNFLQYLKKLTRFIYEEKAADETGLQYLPSLTKLKKFSYPVADMTLYEGCEGLDEIGIDAIGFQHPEVLENSKITGVSVYTARSAEEADAIINSIEKYVKLYSYSIRQNWRK